MKLFPTKANLLTNKQTCFFPQTLPTLDPASDQSISMSMSMPLHFFGTFSRLYYYSIFGLTAFLSKTWTIIATATERCLARHRNQQRAHRSRRRAPRSAPIRHRRKDSRRRRRPRKAQPTQARSPPKQPPVGQTCALSNDGAPRLPTGQLTRIRRPSFPAGRGRAELGNRPCWSTAFAARTQ